MPETKPRVKKDTREHPAHTEGYRAFLEGFVDDDCPHDKQTPERMSWLCGWLDARRMKKFGHLFEDEHKLYLDKL